MRARKLSVEWSKGVEADENPDWSPDGARIAFVSNRDADNRG